MTKKILVFCISAKFSGGEIYTVELLAALKRLGWLPTIVGSQNSILASRAVQAGLRYIDAPIGPKLSRHTVLRTMLHARTNRRRMDELIATERPDFVLLQYKLEQLLWSGRPDWPAVALFEHGPIPSWVYRLRPLRRRYAASVRAASVCLSASEPGRAAIARFGRRSHLIPAGVKLKEVATAATGLSVAGRGGGVRRGIYAGRVTEAKGVIRAAQAVMMANDLELDVFGEGPAVSVVRRLSEQCARVKWHGSRENMVSAISGADFGILLTSDAGEGRPLFALECVALGVPVIASARSAAMRALGEEFPSAIHLVDPTDRDAIAELARVVPRFAPESLSWSDAAQALHDSLVPADGEL